MLSRLAQWAARGTTSSSPGKGPDRARSLGQRQKKRRRRSRKSFCDKKGRWHNLPRPRHIPQQPKPHSPPTFSSRHSQSTTIAPSHTLPSSDTPVVLPTPTSSPPTALTPTQSAAGQLQELQHRIQELEDEKKYWQETANQWQRKYEESQTDNSNVRFACEHYQEMFIELARKHGEWSDADDGG